VPPEGVLLVRKVGDRNAMTYYLVFQEDHGSSVMDEKGFNSFVDKLSKKKGTHGFEVQSFETYPELDEDGDDQ
jgi:hypothetical protein